MSLLDARHDDSRSVPARRRRVNARGSESASLRLSYRAGHPPRLARWWTPVSTFAPRRLSFAGAKVDDGPPSLRRPHAAAHGWLRRSGPAAGHRKPGAPNAPLLTACPVRASNAWERGVHRNCLQPIKNSRDLRRNRRVALAEQPPGVIDQQQIVQHGEATDR